MLTRLTASAIDQVVGIIKVNQRTANCTHETNNIVYSVENVTDAISVNHNWCDWFQSCYLSMLKSSRCNVNNLPSMYTSLLEAISDVEDALSDVHDLLRTRSGNPEWVKEWVEVVQTVLRTDSGWELSLLTSLLFSCVSKDEICSWVIFWKMICMNVGQLKKPPMVWCVVLCAFIKKHLFADFQSCLASHSRDAPSFVCRDQGHRWAACCRFYY